MHEKYGIKAYLAWLTICIVWGTTYLAIRIGVTDLPPMLFAGLRWIIAGILMTILLNLRHYTLPAIKRFKTSRYCWNFTSWCCKRISCCCRAMASKRIDCIDSQHTSFLGCWNRIFSSATDQK